MEIKFNNFNVEWIQRIESKIEHAFAIKLTNNELIELGEKLNLDFHYEIHFDESSAFVRFDCHCKPYGQFSNLTGKEYIDKVGKQCIEVREKLINQVKNIFSDYKLKIYKPNYICLLKKDIDLSNIKEGTEKFIAETYENLIKIILKLK